MRLPEDTKDYKAGFCGVRRYEEPQSKILRGSEDTYGPRDEFQVRDGDRGTVSVGVKHPFGMFYAHASKKRRQFFSFARDCAYGLADFDRQEKTIVLLSAY